MCRMHICLLRTCWAVTFPWHVVGPPLGKHLPQLGRSPAKRQVPAERGSGLRAIPPSHISREERKSLFTKRNTRRRPRSELWRASQELLLLSPWMTLALPHLLLLSLCSHPAYPVVHIWGLSPGGVSTLMRRNAVAPSLTQHGTCACMTARPTITEGLCDCCSYSLETHPLVPPAGFYRPVLRRGRGGFYSFQWIASKIISWAIITGPRRYIATKYIPAHIAVPEGRNRPCRCWHVTTARVCKGGIRRNLLFPCFVVTAVHLFIFWCKVCNIIFCGRYSQDGTSSGHCWNTVV